MVTKHNQKAFTIVELLIATAVFSLVLIIFLSAFIRIGDMFYKGVNVANTQEAARSAIDSISNDIRFGKGTPQYYAADGTGAGYFCVGNHRYKFTLGQQVGFGAPYGLVREDVNNGGGCKSPAVVAGTNPTELINNRMQLNRMELQNCGSDVCTISMLIVFYGSDKTVLISKNSNPLGPNAPDAICSSSLATTQFCATADYTSTVNVRN